MRKHLTEPPPPLTAFRSDVPDPWNAFVVNRCLAKNVCDRYPSMSDVVDELDQLQDCPF
jgi:hypothetical protein